METEKIKLNTVIISILVIAVIEIIARMLINKNLIDSLTGLGFARLVEIFLLLVVVAVRGKGLSAIGLKANGIYRGFIKGLIWAVSFGLAAGAILFIIYLLGIKLRALFQMQLPFGSRQLTAFFLVGAIIAPVAEEIFFRGILYGFFRKWGIPAAIILSTLLFVLSHSSGRTVPVTQIVGGLLFAVAYEVEKNLFVPITIHILGNLAIFTLSLII
jgi:membrane protease YdiL (CAAX protease family)